MPKVILAKFLSQKINHLDHSYLRYALVRNYVLLAILGSNSEMSLDGIKQRRDLNEDT